MKSLVLSKVSHELNRPQQIPSHDSWMNAPPETLADHVDFGTRAQRTRCDSVGDPLELVISDELSRSPPHTENKYGSKFAVGVLN